jgi:hypothetical protein
LRGGTTSITRVRATGEILGDALDFVVLETGQRGALILNSDFGAKIDEIFAVHG